MSKKRKLPKNLQTFKKRERICIIAEGFEETEYLEKIENLKLWNLDNKTIDIKNAKNLGNISSVYQYYKSNNDYDNIYIFCDTECQPYTHFESMLEKLKNIESANINIFNIVFFVNPCTMQVVLCHFRENVRLTSNFNNSKIIYELTNVKNYKKEENQRKAIFSKIRKDNYLKMKKRIMYSDDYKQLSKTNFIKLLDILEK